MNKRADLSIFDPNERLRCIGISRDFEAQLTTPLTSTREGIFGVSTDMSDNRQLDLSGVSSNRGVVWNGFGYDPATRHVSLPTSFTDSAYFGGVKAQQCDKSLWVRELLFFLFDLMV